MTRKRKTNGNSLVVVLSKTGRIVKSNPAFLELTGYTFEEVRDTRFCEQFIDGDQGHKFKDFLNNVSRGEPCEELETRIVIKNGESRTVRWSGIPVSLRGEEPSSVTISGTEVAEQPSEFVPQNSLERQVFDFLDNLPVVFFAMDQRTKYCIWNKACESVWGYSKKEMVGLEREQVLDIVYPDPNYRAKVKAYYDQHMGNFRNKTAKVTSKDGTETLFSLTNMAKTCGILNFSNWAVGVPVTGKGAGTEWESAAKGMQISDHLFNLGNKYINSTMNKVKIDTSIIKRVFMFSDSPSLKFVLGTIMDGQSVDTYHFPSVNAGGKQVLGRYHSGVVIYACSRVDFLEVQEIRELVDANGRKPLLVVCRRAHPGDQLELVAAGARGIVVGEPEFPSIAEAINAIGRGELWFNSLLLSRVFDKSSFVIRKEKADKVLTGREIEILQRIAQGYSNPAIAEVLGVSTRTVTNHVYNIYGKLGLKNRLQAMHYAVAHDLVAMT
jgi:PAS domain S-box-containing protein